jgi:hypothetical protein
MKISIFCLLIKILFNLVMSIDEEEILERESKIVN